MRALLLPVLMAALLVAPLAAEAGKPKGPFYALVNADGTKAHGDVDLLVRRAINNPVGVYQVFIGDRGGIDGCVAVASPAQGTIGTIGIEADILDASFFVWTTVGGGAALADLPFYIVVHCPKLPKGG